MSATIADLIARLEKATGPDGSINHEIAWAIGDWTCEGGFYIKHKVTGERKCDAYYPIVRDYTSSIDAALTLVPEGLAWTLGQNVHHRYWQACVNGLDGNGAPWARGESGHHALFSPAIALCIAALKARAALAKDAP